MKAMMPKIMTKQEVKLAMRYAKHVIDLGHAFHVIIQWIIDPDAAAAGTALDDRHLPHAQRRAIVNIPPVVDETTYAVALHELGHCIAPCGTLTSTEASHRMIKQRQPTTLRDVKLRLDEEWAAWEWARAYALEWTPAMVAIERSSISSYRANAKRYGVNL